MFWCQVLSSDADMGGDRLSTIICHSSTPLLPYHF